MLDHQGKTAATAAVVLDFLAEIIEDIAEDSPETKWPSQHVVFLHGEIAAAVLRGIDTFDQCNNEPLVDKADGMVLLWHEVVVDVAVLDPGVDEGEMILACCYEGDDELLAERGEGLAVEGPRAGLSEDVDTVLEFADGTGDAGVFTSGGEELEGLFFEEEVVIGIWRTGRTFLIDQCTWALTALAGEEVSFPQLLLSHMTRIRCVNVGDYDLFIAGNGT